MTSEPTLLRPYQIVARDFLQERKSAALFLDMGLGKTAVALCALEEHRLPVLVVAPKRVAEEVWPEEVSIWRPDLDIAVAAGTPAQRRAALDSGADIVAIGRDNLKDLGAKDVKRFRHVILDELSSFKGRDTLRWKTMKRFLAVGGAGCWGLTGTPTPNSLLDLWPQVYLLDQGQRLGTGITAFRNRYFVPGRQLKTGVITEYLPRPGADKRIHALLEDLCMSMSTEGRVPLPPVTTTRVKVPLPASSKKVYDDLKQDLVANLELLGGEVHSAANAAVLSNKLSQVTAGFLYHDEADLRGGTYQRLHTAKVDACKELVEAALGSPVLIFYRYKAELDALKEAFPQASTVDEPGFQKRWNAGTIPVLLAHPASAGHGLNLQHGGHHIIWTSPTWSLEEDMQANKRLARSGQKHPVTISYLVCPGTVDTAVMARLKDKKTVQQALLDHLEVKAG